MTWLALCVFIVTCFWLLWQAAVIADEQRKGKHDER